ncbi:NosR/NirI family protein [Psychrobium sp. 1_MG-2023]|uniref:NosR/NirI family protein n=1 Tax=Psychrobium sp. 1_MG-2023 TaxID=3062624 RepID=UPI000C32A7D1|nr:NosR/NirI family protein [Psychrobium sp. 1_MG-2023]MDP2561568.1 4Fe-4S binding protein [Psychrobium sp. 1_MG-2023]PKF55030.1 (4Fe-4S)-binding protein [Alteromonadales bacterium alter-6D02]
MLINSLKSIVGLFLFLIISLAQPAIAFVGEQGVVTTIPVDVKQAFPSATRVKRVEKNPNITGVYQLNELIGYTFESDHFTNFIGFSGKTINLFIALDPHGVITSIKVLDHHEPIFIHGLGERPMIQFIKQFESHSIKERFIVDARDRQMKDVTHIDGVTKATVSALVINDTIIASALKVARTMLEGFAPLSTKVLDENLFEPLSFNQLVERGMVAHWSLAKQDTIQAFSHLAQPLSDYDDAGPLIDLYIAPITVPIVGRNILGDNEYRRLIDSIAPGSSALMVIDNGEYGFISDDFIPQTAPERFKVGQSGLPQDSRDIDFYSFNDPFFNSPLPIHKRLKVLNIKSQSGFELSSPINFAVTVDYSQSFLVKNTEHLTFDFTLPDSLFVENAAALEPKQQPLWLKLWQQRWLEVVITILYLAFVTFIFLNPDRFSTNTTIRVLNITIQVRHIALCFVIAVIGFYSQGQLSVVNIYTLFLSIYQGFNIEVFLLDPIIFILWLFVFIATILWGRGVFCGWLCPFGALQEFATTLATKLKIKQYKIKPHHHQRARAIKYILLLGLVGSAFYSLTLAGQLAEVEPFKTAITLYFVRYWPFTVYAIILVILSLKIHKFYCRYLCPLGAGFGVLGRFPLLKWIRRRQECGNPCQLCQSKKCGIDAINKTGSINYSECIGCFDCVVTINDPKLCVIDKYKKRVK